MDKRTINTGQEEQRHGLSGRKTLIVAAAAGLSVANIYYAQPLLDLMAHDLGIPSASIGIIVTLTQIGYGMGLIFIVPIGDLIDRRKLIIVLGLLSSIALTVVATAEGKMLLLAGMCVVGLLAVIVQVLVAHAAALATPNQRGRVVGLVTSGVVTGILSARIVAGAISDLGGWRTVYLASALMMVVVVAVLVSILPRQTLQRERETYAHALLTVPSMFLRQPTLLLRGALALLIFASFSTLWTVLVFPLSAPPFFYSHTLIGLFGLVGLAGAIGATGAGRLADAGFSQWTTGICLTLLLASWGAIALLPFSIATLLIGVFLLDLAVQAVHVTNISIVVAVHPQKSGRLIGGYMVFYSLGSAIGAITATAIYVHFGWLGVSVLGAAFSGTALALWIVTFIAAGANRRTRTVECPWN